MPSSIRFMLALLALATAAVLSAAPPEDAATGEVVALVDRWQPVLDGAFAGLAAAPSPAAAVVALDALAGHGVRLRAEAMQLLGRYPFLRRATRMAALLPVFARVWPAAARYDGIVRAAARKYAAEPAVVDRINRLRALAGRA